MAPQRWGEEGAVIPKVFLFIIMSRQKKDRPSKTKLKDRSYQKDRREILKLVPKLRKVKKGSK